MDTRVRDTLVLSALNQAIGREHPPEGLIIHTDRGCQYTGLRFQAMCIRYGFRQSMSRKGNPYDNAIMESFYRTLKRELIQGANYDNPEQARLDIFKYIETYYNSKRIHSSLGWLSHNQFENQNVNRSYLSVRFFLTFQEEGTFFYVRFLRTCAFFGRRRGRFFILYRQKRPAHWWLTNK